MNIYRGDIYYIESGKYYKTESVGMEARPAVIVSNDKCNMHSDNVNIVWLTTSDNRPDLPCHVPILCKVPSTAMCEHITTVSMNRVGAFIRACTEDEMRQIDKALMIQMGIEVRGKTVKEFEALEAEGINAKKALDWSETERAKLTVELEKRNAAYEELVMKLNEYRTTENAKIKELDALLEAEKMNSKCYKAQLDDVKACHDATAKKLSDAKALIEQMQETAEAVEDARASDVDLARAQAERDVYKCLFEKFLERVLD